MDSSTSTSSMTERCGLSVPLLALADVCGSEKMLAGLPYNAMQDQELVVARLRAKKLCRRYNNAPLAELDDPNGGLSSEQRAILKELFALTDEQSDQVRVHFSLAAAPHTGAQVYMEAPIQERPHVQPCDAFLLENRSTTALIRFFSVPHISTIISYCSTAPASHLALE